MIAYGLSQEIFNKIYQILKKHGKLESQLGLHDKQGNSMAHLLSGEQPSNALSQLLRNTSFAQNNQGQTPFMTAIQHQNVALFNMFLESPNATQEVLCLTDDYDRNVLNYFIGYLDEEEAIGLIKGMIKEVYENMVSNRLCELVSNCILAKKLKLLKHLL